MGEKFQKLRDQMTPDSKTEAKSKADKLLQSIDGCSRVMRDGQYYLAHQHFVPESWNHDQCADCGYEFQAHFNGMCPAPDLEEGDQCPMSRCGGVMVLPVPQDCYCHVVAPCPSCTNNKVQCSECGYSEE